MCGRLVNLDTVARVLAEYYHLKTDTQLAALNDALSRVPAETVGNELFGISEQLDDTISRSETVKAIRDALLAWSSMPQWREDKIVDAVKALPSAQQNCDGCKWSDAIGYGECHHCKRAFEDMYEKGEQP